MLLLFYPYAAVVSSQTMASSGYLKFSRDTPRTAPTSSPKQGCCLFLRLLWLLCSLNSVVGSSLSSTSSSSLFSVFSSSLHLSLSLVCALLYVCAAVCVWCSCGVVCMPNGGEGGRGEKRKGGWGGRQNVSDGDEAFREEDAEKGGGGKRRHGGAGGGGRGGGGGRDGAGRPKSPVASKRVAARCTHRAARERVCLVCLSYFGRDLAPKKGMLLTNSRYAHELGVIQEMLFPLSYSVHDPQLPIYVCYVCRTACLRAYARDTRATRLAAKDRTRHTLTSHRVSWRNFSCVGDDCPLCKLTVYQPFGKAAATSVSSPPEPAPAAEPTP